LDSLNTHHYKRNGTATLFAALDVLTGKVIGQCLPLPVSAGRQHSPAPWIHNSVPPRHNADAQRGVHTTGAADPH
jgi:hypothetical protein